METKVCKDCGKAFPKTVEYFRVQRRNGKEYFNPRCWECERADHRRYYAEHPEIRKAKDDKYHAANREKLNAVQIARWACLPEEDKKRRRNLSAKWARDHKDYLAEKARERYATGEYKEKSAERKQRRRARAKCLPASFTKAQWDTVQIEFSRKCAYCGNEMKLERDHFIPLSKGGGYTADNIIPACKSCNCSKNNTDFYEWYPAQPFFSEDRKRHILNYLGKEIAV